MAGRRWQGSAAGRAARWARAEGRIGALSAPQPTAEARKGREYCQKGQNEKPWVPASHVGLARGSADLVVGGEQEIGEWLTADPRVKDMHRGRLRARTECSRQCLNLAERGTMLA